MVLYLLLMGVSRVIKDWIWWHALYFSCYEIKNRFYKCYYWRYILIQRPNWINVFEIKTYAFSWKLMTLLPAIAWSCGLHLISSTSSSGIFSPGSMGNLTATHIQDPSAALPSDGWQLFTPHLSKLFMSNPIMPSTFVRDMVQYTGSDLPLTSSRAGKVPNPSGIRINALNSSLFDVRRQWISRKNSYWMNYYHVDISLRST